MMKMDDIIEERYDLERVIKVRVENEVLDDESEVRNGENMDKDDNVVKKSDGGSRVQELEDVNSLRQSSVSGSDCDVGTGDSGGNFRDDDNVVGEEVGGLVNQGVECVHSARQSSVSQSDSSPSTRRGLDHCITAPIGNIGTQRSLLIDNHELILSKSKSHKEGGRHDLKLDKLSERDKEKLIVNLVKIQNDGTVEVDLAKNSPVTSELLELHAVENASLHDDGVAPALSKHIPRLKIAMLVVGTRGDVQPFLAIAKRLQIWQEIKVSFHQHQERSQFNESN